MAGDNLPNKSNAFKGTVNSIRRKFKRLLINSMSEERLQDKLDKIVDSGDFYQILEYVSSMSERKLEESYPSISYIINNFNSKSPQMMIQLFDSLPQEACEIDPTKRLEEQPVCKETFEFMRYLFTEFWALPKEKQLTDTTIEGLNGSTFDLKKMFENIASEGKNESGKV